MSEGTPGPIPHVALELTPLRRRSDPPCDGRHTPSPPEYDHYKRYSDGIHPDVKLCHDVMFNDVFKSRRLEADGSEDCDVQSIPIELNDLVKQVEEYAELTGTLTVQNPQPLLDPDGRPDNNPEIRVEEAINEETEVDRDVNDNDPLLGDRLTRINHLARARSPKRLIVKRQDPNEYHIHYEHRHQDDRNEYEELFNRLAALDEEEYGRGARRTSFRKIGTAPVVETKHHGRNRGHVFGPQPARPGDKQTRDAEKKSRVMAEKERFWKMTSFRQGSRHIKYCWDHSLHVPNVEFLDNATKMLRISHTGESESQEFYASSDGARGCMGFTSGKHVFKFKFNNVPWGTHCAVGVVKREAPLHLNTYDHLIGRDNSGWGWDIPSRQLIHNGPTGCIYPKHYVQITKEIQMTLNVDKGEISFHVDGLDLGVAFSGITEGEVEQVELFPACSCVFAMTEVSISMLDSSHLVHKVPTPNTDHHSQLADHMFANICSLPQDLRYLIEIAHAWHIDFTNQMFFAHIPNNPTIMIPKSFPFDCVSQDQIIGIRGRLGFNSGCHTWQIKEELLLTPTVPELESDIRHNDMVIGVCTAEFCSLFDGRRQPLEFIEHVTTFWGWRYTSKRLHNFYTKEKYFAENVAVFVDQGLTVVMNHDKGELSFGCGGQDLGVAFRGLPSEKLYPVILHVSGGHPISMLYVDAPPDYIQTVIEDIEKTSFTRSEYQNFLGYIPLRRSAWISSEAVATPRMRQKFSWDKDSMAGTVFSMERHHCTRAICTPPTEPDLHERMDIIRGQIPINEGTHVWTYTFSSNMGHDDHYMIGVVNELFYTTDYTLKSNPLCYLWLWDLLDRSLYHGTEFVAKYPVYPATFDVRRYYRFQIAISMSQKTSFGFSAMAPHIPMDLGVAFSQLPPGNYYPCLVYRSGKLDCNLEYVKGPSGYVETHDNRCCCQLQ